MRIESDVLGCVTGRISREKTPGDLKEFIPCPRALKNIKNP